MQKHVRAVIKLLGQIDSTTFSSTEKFDLIAAFDVVEHLKISEIQNMLAVTVPHLSDKGFYIFRFPNGNSPFSGPLFNSDLTHQSLLTPGVFGEIGRSFGLKVKLAFNDRIMPSSLRIVIKKSIVFGLRNALEILICSAYFGKRLPMDPNIFVIISR